MRNCRWADSTYLLEIMWPRSVPCALGRGQGMELVLRWELSKAGLFGCQFLPSLYPGTWAFVGRDHKRLTILEVERLRD